MAIQILVDLQAAFENYPHEYVTVELVDVSFPGSALNVMEDVEFAIQVTNSGPLDVNDLALLVEGLNGTEVKANGSLAQWGPSFTLDAGYFPNVPAHHADTPVKSPGSPFHFRATRATSITDLVRVSVAGWNTDLAHLEVAHTEADSAAAGVYRHKVVQA